MQFYVYNLSCCAMRSRLKETMIRAQASVPLTQGSRLSFGTRDSGFGEASTAEVQQPQGAVGFVDPTLPLVVHCWGLKTQDPGLKTAVR